MIVIVIEKIVVVVGEQSSEAKRKIEEEDRIQGQAKRKIRFSSIFYYNVCNGKQVGAY